MRYLAFGSRRGVDVCPWMLSLCPWMLSLCLWMLSVCPGASGVCRGTSGCWGAQRGAAQDRTVPGAAVTCGAGVGGAGGRDVPHIGLPALPCRTRPGPQRCSPIPGICGHMHRIKTKCKI